MRGEKDKVSCHSESNIIFGGLEEIINYNDETRGNDEDI